MYVRNHRIKWTPELCEQIEFEESARLANLPPCMQMLVETILSQITTDEQAAQFRRDGVYHSEDASVLLIRTMGIVCPDQLGEDVLQVLRDTTGNLRCQFREHRERVAAAEAAEAAKWAAIEREKQEAERERAIAAAGRTWLQKDLFRRGWSKQLIEDLIGPPDYRLEQRSWQRRWVEFHYSQKRVRQAERRKAFLNHRQSSKAAA